MPSTVVDSFYYDMDSLVLRVTFRSGAIYLYHDVPEDIYLEFKQAKSKGTYLNQFIKGNFEFERVN